MDSITPKMAIKRMRELTDVGVPFSLEFATYSKKKKTRFNYSLLDFD